MYNNTNTNTNTNVIQNIENSIIAYSLPDFPQPLSILDQITPSYSIIITISMTRCITTIRQETSRWNDSRNQTRGLGLFASQPVYEKTDNSLVELLEFENEEQQGPKERKEYKRKLSSDEENNMKAEENSDIKCNLKIHRHSILLLLSEENPFELVVELFLQNCILLISIRYKRTHQNIPTNNDLEVTNLFFTTTAISLSIFG